MAKTIRIGNGQGFWGDSIDAPVNLLRGGPLDYLTLDYLAEVTMSIMQKQRRRNPERGYAYDFVQFIDKVLPDLMKGGVKVIANAGGVNPEACQRALLEVAEKHQAKGLKIAIVSGDDILDRLEELRGKGEALTHLDTGEALFAEPREILSANVYMPTSGIVDALNQGAHIVVTGRSTDPGLVLGPILHEFGWSSWNELALGTVAGHILECGAQATGGNFTQWQDVPDMANIGYPIAEVNDRGDLFITKHQNTGGLVNVATVSEQLLYEMGDPEKYLTPDCVADFSSIQLEQAGPDRVRVHGVQGDRDTPYYKVSISYLKGYKASGQLTVSGPGAYAKAQKCAEILWRRLENAGATFESTETEYLGVGVCHEGMLPPNDPPEVVLRVGVKDSDQNMVARFGKEIAPLVTSGPPGVTGFAGGRPKPQEIVAYWPALISKKHIQPKVKVLEVGA